MRFPYAQNMDQRLSPTYYLNDINFQGDKIPRMSTPIVRHSLTIGGAVFLDKYSTEEKLEAVWLKSKFLGVTHHGSSFFDHSSRSEGCPKNNGITVQSGLSLVGYVKTEHLKEVADCLVYLTCHLPTGKHHCRSLH